MKDHKNCSGFLPILINDTPSDSTGNQESDIVVDLPDFGDSFSQSKNRPCILLPGSI